MKIKIYGIEYNIKLVDSNSREDYSMGRSDGKLGIITINKEMPSDVKFSTLIHEIIHIISNENGLGLKENIVCPLATGITTLLLENNIYNYTEIK